MRHLLRRLSDILDRPTKFRLALATVVSLVLALLDTAAIVLMLPLVELASGNPPVSGLMTTVARVLGNPPVGRLTLYVTIAVVGLFVAKDLGALGFTWWMARFKGLNRVRTSSALLRHFLTAPYTEVSRRSTSELIRTMVDAVIQVYGSVVYGLMQVVTSGLSLLAILGALLYTAPLPTLALVAYLGLASALYLRVMKPKAVRAGENSAAASEVAWRSALGALGGLKETRVRGSEAVFVRRFEAASLRGVRPAQIAEFIGAAPRYFLEILFIIAVGVILVVGTASGPGSTGASSVVGLLAMFVAAGFRTLPAVTAVLSNVNAIRFGLPYLALVHDEIHRMAKLEAPQRPTKRLALEREVFVDDVAFRYPGGSHDALDGVTLTLPYGSSLALVGGSGAGKTTLIDLLLGLHQPARGRVSVDGQDIAENLRGWQANIGYVPQDVFLLDATLAENIAFDEPRDQIDMVRLQAAINQAQLGDVVDALPDGVDTYLGERGSRLSGGQRQRVGIARALYRNPRVLVLDEATSALDNETEHRISTVITALRGKVTVVTVAHRLSTVRHADAIAFMVDGRIVSIGTFEQLRHSNAQFDQLVRLGSLT